MSYRIEYDTSGLGEFAPHRFSIEASTLGLPVGVFPQRIETFMGNGQPFVRVLTNDEGARYEQSLGCISLTIFND